MNEESFKKLLDYVSDIAARLRVAEDNLRKIESMRVKAEVLVKKVEELYEHHENVQRRLHDPAVWKAIKDKVAKNPIS